MTQTIENNQQRSSLIASFSATLATSPLRTPISESRCSEIHLEHPLCEIEGRDWRFSPALPAVFHSYPPTERVQSDCLTSILPFSSPKSTAPCEIRRSQSAQEPHGQSKITPSHLRRPRDRRWRPQSHPKSHPPRPPRRRAERHSQENGTRRTPHSLRPPRSRRTSRPRLLHQ